MHHLHRTTAEHHVHATMAMAMYHLHTTMAEHYVTMAMHHLHTTTAEHVQCLLGKMFFFLVGGQKCMFKGALPFVGSGGLPPGKFKWYEITSGAILMLKGCQSSGMPVQRYGHTSLLFFFFRGKSKSSTTGAASAAGSWGKGAGSGVAAGTDGSDTCGTGG